jgi:acetoin utilization deacetylase AcuC-like enzyme
VGGFNLQTDTFKRLGSRIGYHKTPVLVVQEGGYLLANLGQNVVAFFDGLLHR